MRLMVLMELSAQKTLLYVVRDRERRRSSTGCIAADNAAGMFLTSLCFTNLQDFTGCISEWSAKAYGSRNNSTNVKLKNSNSPNLTSKYSIAQSLRAKTRRSTASTTVSGLLISSAESPRSSSQIDHQATTSQNHTNHPKTLVKNTAPAEL